MRYLNLSSGYTPFEKGIGHESFTFSGGEPHIKILDAISSDDEIMITQRVNSFNDLGLVFVAVDALRRMGIRKISLLIPYFPGARQDRLMVEGEPLTVKVYADLINNLNLDQVLILDPHSEVTPALLDNVKVIPNHHFVKKAKGEQKDYVLISPDAGALKKIYSLAKYLEHDAVVECGKDRNVVTGALSGFTVSEADLKGKTCVVVDDICDGGGTFLGLAKKLKEHNAGDLILIVTHGIFNKGTEELKKHYSAIYTTDSVEKNLEGVFEVKMKDIEEWKV